MSRVWQSVTVPWQSLPEKQRSRIPWAAGVVALLIFPVIDRGLKLGVLNDFNDVLVLVVLALGLNIVVGYAGLLNFGYAAFFAIGAYTTGILTWPGLGMQWSFWIVIWLAVVVAAFMGIVIATPTLKLRGDYIAIVTLAFGEIVPILMRNMGDVSLTIGTWKVFDKANFTNGVQGLNPIGRPWIGGFEFGFDPAPWYYLILAIAALVIFASMRLENSRLGRAWMALREDETVADCCGVDPVRTKLLAFALGACISGFAGAFYAAKLQAIFPELFRFNLSVMILAMVILGGMGNIKGVVIGGLLIQLFDRVVLTQSTVAVNGIGKALNIGVLTTIDLGLWRWFFFGLALVVIMLIRPEGLFPSTAGRRQLRVAKDDETPPAA